MAYQQPPPPGNQQQQQQVVVVNNQPSSSRGPAQPQNQRDWSTNICGCFEDCCSCKLAFIFIIVITIYYFSTILILCFDFRRPSLFVMYCVIVSVFTDFTLQQAEWLTLDCPWCWCPRGWPSSVLDADVLELKINHTPVQNEVGLYYNETSKQMSAFTKSYVNSENIVQCHNSLIQRCIFTCHFTRLMSPPFSTINQYNKTDYLSDLSTNFSWDQTHTNISHVRQLAPMSINATCEMLLLLLVVVTSDKGGGKCVCPHSFVCLSVC